MAFWGTVIKPNGSYKLEEEAGKLLHLSTISLGTFKDGRSLLKVEHEDSKQKVLVASLTPGQTESVSVDLFLNVLQVTANLVIAFIDHISLWTPF